MKIAFMIMTEYFKHQQIYTLLKMLKAAQSRKHEILGIFFFGTGVLNIQKNIVIGKDNISIPRVLEDLSEIPKYACQTWADNYGVGVFKNEIISGTEITGLGELSELTAQADKMIYFGART